MRLDYENTPQDVAALRAQILASIPAWKRWVEAMVVTGVVSGVILVAIHRRSEYGLHMPSLIGGILSVSIAYRVLQSRRLKHFQPLAKGFVLGPKRALLTTEGVVLAGEGYEMTVHWKAIRRIEEGESHLFLWVDRAVGFCIPKRAFSDVAAKEAFLAELKKNTGL